MATIKEFLIRIAAFMAIIVIGVPFTGCTSDNEPKSITPQKRMDIVLNSNSRAAADGLRDTYIKLTTTAVAAVDNNDIDGVDFTDKNVVISPLSMSIVLSMIANGMDENGQKFIAEYLGVTDIDAVNTLAATLLNELPKVDNTATLHFANSAWIDQPINLTKDFVTLVEEKYNASIHYEDLQTLSTVNKINGWCSQNTMGLVPKMVFDIPDPYNFAMFFNAMFFQGIWEDDLEFKPEDTNKEFFHGSNGDSEIDMMHSDRYITDYKHDDNFESCNLLFGNGAFVMKIILPNERLSLSDANALLSSHLDSNSDSQSESCRLELSMPKFKVDKFFKMREILSRSGLSDLFDNEWEFTMFEPSQSGLIDAFQGTSFKVDESGATAAAVSQINLGYTMPGYDNIVFTVDRPFYFFINEVSTGACILSGRIADL